MKLLARDIGHLWVRQAALALLLVPGAGAQTPPDRPPNTADAYVLLGLTKIDVSASIQIATGSIGVNESGGTLQGNGAVQLNQQDGVIAASTVHLTQSSTCAALFADPLNSNGNGQCSTVQPIPAPQPPLVPDLATSDVCSLPNPFPSCSSNSMTVDAGTVTTLPADTYGDLTVNGGTLMLTGGQYTFCNVNINAGSVVVAVAPSTLLVAGTFNVQPNAQVNAQGTPANLQVLVNGLGVNISGAGTPRTSVVANICAPTMNAQMNLMDADLVGTFVGWAIGVGNVTGMLGPVAPTTSTSTSTTSTTTTTTTSTTSTSTSSTTSTTSTSTTSTSSTTSTTSTTTTSTTSTSTSSTTSTTSTSTSTTSTSRTTSSSTSTTSTSSSSSTVPPTSTSTSTSTSISSTTSSTTSTTSSSSSTLPTPSTTSTTLPCDELRVTSFKFTPKSGRSTKGRLILGGVLADSGWAGVDPRKDDVNICVQIGGTTSCCTVDTQHWTKDFAAHFGFWDQKRTICPPIACTSLVVRRTGSAAFKITAPGAELTEEMLKQIQLGVVIGDHCSVGSLSLTDVRRKGRALVYP
jgi:hypothetical protein